MRLDLLLVRLRFARSRGVAQQWIGEAHIRCNGQRVTSATHAVDMGDVLTLPPHLSTARAVRVIEILALPERRGPAAEARACYRDLDASRSIAIAGTQ